MKQFGLNVQVDKEVIFPVKIPKFETYYNIFLPIIIKPLCDIIINAYSNNFLPYADVTYFHSGGSPTPAMGHRLLNGYYMPYKYLERTLAFRTRTQKKLVLANSHFTAKRVNKNFDVNPKVIYPPVYIKKLNSASNKKRLVVTVGLFSPWKNLELVPEVANKIDAHFVIIGGLFDVNSYSRVLDLIKRNNVKDKVTIVTNAPFEVKLELLQKAKVYFHTQPSEDFGISIVEGMAANCIPVVHDSGGPREYVPLEWRYKDVEGAIQRIHEALESSPDVSREMSDIAYNFREERFQSEFSFALREYLANESLPYLE
jgi:glycosyltransferase involved in cell wall biosynthesis